AVTGIAGPTGGSADKPVGLVWFGLALAGQPIVAEHQLFGHKGREFIRHETVRHALELGLRALG
ncbi:damage-inducible protein CinA, partial [Mesorhizobium sp. M4A.F.Ca.ET.022.05.2.1]